MDQVRSESEETARQYAQDKELLNGLFRELELQLKLARTEREDAVSRADRERRVSTKRIRELEEQLATAHATKDRERDACNREKEQLAKQFEQRVSGLRLEKEQAKLDKALMRRLEKEITELKALSTSVLGPMAQRADDFSRWEIRQSHHGKETPLRTRLAEDELA